MSFQGKSNLYSLISPEVPSPSSFCIFSRAISSFLSLITCLITLNVPSRLVQNEGMIIIYIINQLDYLGSETVNLLQHFHMFSSFWRAVVHPVGQKMAKREEPLYNNLGYPDIRRESKNNIVAIKIIFTKIWWIAFIYLCTFLIYSVSSSWAFIWIPIAASAITICTQKRKQVSQLIILLTYLWLRAARPMEKEIITADDVEGASLQERKDINLFHNFSFV